MATYDPSKYTFQEVNRAGGLMQQIMLDEDDVAFILPELSCAFPSIRKTLDQL